MVQISKDEVKSLIGAILMSHQLLFKNEVGLVTLRVILSLEINIKASYLPLLAEKLDYVSSDHIATEKRL